MNSISSQFEKIFGHSPDICASAPGRVNLIGEHIDFSEGFVLPFAINDCTDVAISKTNENVIKIASVQRNSEVISIALSDISPTSRVIGSATYLELFGHLESKQDLKSLSMEKFQWEQVFHRRPPLKQVLQLL